MSDIFSRKDVADLLRGKYMLMVGDSNMRALYRDLLWFLKNNTFVPENDLRLKLDFSYLGDRLLKQGQLNRGRDYIEMREYKDEEFNIRFNFLTKIYTEEIKSIMDEVKQGKCRPPDVVLINSCTWDITRWGPDGVNLYKKNMHKVMTLFKESLPPSCLVIYNTSLPISPSCYGAFLIKQVEFMKHNLRFEIMEANLFAKQVVPTYGYNILDFHYHLRMQIQWRMPDGVHWKPIAIRHMNNLLLTHLALCFERPLPGNFKGRMLERYRHSVQQIKGSNVNSKLSKKEKLFKEPPIYYQQLKRIPRHIKDDVKILLRVLQPGNNQQYSAMSRNASSHNRFQNEMYVRRSDHGRPQRSYEDKENRWNNGNMIDSPGIPNNIACRESGGRFNQIRQYDGNNGFGPTRYNKGYDHNELRSPNFFEERVNSGRNVKSREYMSSSRIGRESRDDSFNFNEFRTANFCGDEVRCNLSRSYEGRENFNSSREYGSCNFNSPRESYEDRRNYFCREDESCNFKNPRRSYKDRESYDSGREYERCNYNLNVFRQSDFCIDRDGYDGNRSHEGGYRNGPCDENRVAYYNRYDCSPENFYLGRERNDSGRNYERNYSGGRFKCRESDRRGFNGFDGNEIHFSNLDKLSYLNNNCDMLSPYEQRNIQSPMRDNSICPRRQRGVPYRC